MRNKRLKIAEQILVVLSLALILPLVVASMIIINTNQIAVRKELEISAQIIAKSLENELINLNDIEKNNIFYTNEALKKMNSKFSKDKFIQILKDDDKNIIDYKISQLPQNKIITKKFQTEYLPSEEAIIFSYVDNNILTTKKVKSDYLLDKLFKNFNPQERQIYIFDENKNIITSYNAVESGVKDILDVFPKELSEDHITSLFFKYKNQPNIGFYQPDLKWYIVVTSPKNLTDYGIVSARWKIIISIFVAATFVFLVFGIYTFTLYTNIRQTFKVIRAVADGKYTRKLRFLTNALSSQELIFIADEFNKMMEKIDESYRELQDSNEKLKKMDEYKSNLIDTVSHEFRTPLTSIKGYSSSLLRHGLQLDDESKKKSLKIIKQQAERLSRMVEDLLVIPDIESATIRMNYQEVNLKNVIETSTLSTSTTDTNIFNINIQEPLNNLYADEDRLIQILINLFENALKYSKANTKIDILAKTDENFAEIKIHNEAEFIDNDTLSELFDKFTRVDSELTRTTRGTGLGLYIVKGLVETMGGKIALNATNGFEVTFTIPVYKGQDNVIS